MAAVAMGNNIVNKLLVTAAFAGAAALVVGTGLVLASPVIHGIFALGMWMVGGGGVVSSAALLTLTNRLHITPSRLRDIWSPSRIFAGSQNNHG